MKSKRKKKTEKKEQVVKKKLASLILGLPSAVGKKGARGQDAYANSVAVRLSQEASGVGGCPRG